MQSVGTGRRGHDDLILLEHLGYQYYVYRGLITPPASFDYNHDCLGGTPAPSFDDPTGTPLGTVQYYLLSGINDCAESGLGPGTPGPRPNFSSCTGGGGAGD